MKAALHSRDSWRGALVDVALAHEEVGKGGCTCGAKEFPCFTWNRGDHVTHERERAIASADLIYARWRVSDRTNGSSTCVQAALLDAGASWRISTRTQGSSTCVEARTDGAVVAMQNSTAPYPNGPALTVPATAWLTFLDHVTAGHLNRTELRTQAPFGPFTVGLSDDGTIEVRCDEHTDGSVVRYTTEEWDVFLTGVKEDGEFTLEWLLDAPATVGD